jgi:hypothetical protein
MRRYGVRPVPTGTSAITDAYALRSLPSRAMTRPRASLTVTSPPAAARTIA